jgi:CRISPR-associated endonuclease/helicase Cas3
LVQAISAHHGFHFLPHDVASNGPIRQPQAWKDARSQLLAIYWSVLPPQGAPPQRPCDFPVVNWLAGLVSTADWIGSNTDWFPMGERFDDFDAYREDARRRAQEALTAIGWYRWRPLLDQPADVTTLLSRIVRRDNISPRPLQTVGDTLLQEAKGPALLLVEAPMGEGKTELAFLAHLRLQQRNAHRGLYLALPTQATGNALFKRACAFLDAFSTGSQDIQLQHGGAGMNEDFARLRAVGDDPAIESLSASAWFGQRKRPMLSPYGVGTVDQSLYAVLNVKHHFVRLWGLSNRVVVLDEVHAYDLYTSGLIEALLRWLKALGSSVVLMSATLPTARRRELLAAWRGAADADDGDDVPYPRLALADARGIRSVPVGARKMAPITISGLGTDIAELAGHALARLREGGCGVVIVNTVKRAQALYQYLRDGMIRDPACADIPLLLFHARFPADQRQGIEEQVLKLFGKSESRPACALLIATQVVEQSLDIDFDFMVSDLAPVDLLLQRAGRLHRHDRGYARPAAHAVARLWVAGLLPGALPDMKGTAWGFVYHPYILGRTWALLCQEQTIRMPHDIDQLVQQVYDSSVPLPCGIDEDVQNRLDVDELGRYLSEQQYLRQLARNIVVDPRSEPESVYVGKLQGLEEDELGTGLTNRTRIGEDNRTVIPVYAGEGGWWHVAVGGAGFDPAQPLPPGMAKRLYDRQIKCSGRTAKHHFASVVRPAAFDTHPLLRHAWPLVLDPENGTNTEARLALDLERGLTNLKNGEMA